MKKLHSHWRCSLLERFILVNRTEQVPFIIWLASVSNRWAPYITLAAVGDIYYSQSERQWALLDIQEREPYGVVGAVQSRVLLAQYALCSKKSTLVDTGLVHLLKAESVGYFLFLSFFRGPY